MTETINRYVNWRDWPGNRTAIIAEVGVNHGGDEKLAWDMILSAHKHGADFVKLQSFVMEDFFHPSLSYYSTTKSYELSIDIQRGLFHKASEVGIKLTTTAFDFQSIDMVGEFDPSVYKIASMDNDNIPLIRYIAEKKKPVLVSTGMAHMEEIQKIVEIFKEAENDKLVLLHCVSDYPTTPENINLEMIRVYRETFNCPTGLSDHSLGLASALIAASIGATVIEKHFTTDRSLVDKIPDADHDISIEPHELEELKRFCEDVPIINGSPQRILTEGEMMGRKSFRRGIYAKRDIVVGEELDLENVVLLRPVSEIPAGCWDDIVGKKFVKSVSRYQHIQYSDLEL
jgi:N,N'-diacetyllegionaminate synthase